jgi:tetrathionate reductase subunit B
MVVQKPHYAFVIDVSRCIDCRACQVACSVENRVPMSNTRIWVQDLGVQGKFPNLQRAFVPYNCMHCDHPPCTEVCVSGATYKDEQSGLVLVDQEACIGCGFCVEACPYNARYLDTERGVVDKCNACVQRLEQGLQPACVATCVGQSRNFGDLNDPNSEASAALNNAKSILRLDYEKNGQDTDPNIYYINVPEDLIQVQENAEEGESYLYLPGDGRQPLVSQAGTLPRDPHYSLAETGWKKVLVPLLFAGIGASFLVQATYFTKQLIEGEKEFEE